MVYTKICISVCVRVYLLNTDKSSLSLRVSTPPIVITTAAPRHVLRHYRTVLVCPPSYSEKKTCYRVKIFLPHPHVDHVRKSIFHEHHHRDKPNPIHHVIRTSAVTIYIYIYIYTITYVPACTRSVFFNSFAWYISNNTFVYAQYTYRYIIYMYKYIFFMYLIRNSYSPPQQRIIWGCRVVQSWGQLLRYTIYLHMYRYIDSSARFHFVFGVQVKFSKSLQQSLCTII